MMSTAIVCPGPSLADLQERELFDYGLRIAVNGAVLWAGVMFDYWALSDGEVFRNCAPFLMSAMYRPRLWTHTKFGRDSFESIAGWTADTRTEYKRFRVTKYDREKLVELVNFGDDKSWPELTVFCAIALAVLKGSHKIVLFGADWEGSGYFKPGLQNARTDHTINRWERERNLFEQASRNLLKKNRIDLRRYVP